jgi:hypothetical protein
MCIYGMTEEESFSRQRLSLPYQTGVENTLYTIARAEKGDIIEAQSILEKQIKTDNLDLPIYLMFEKELGKLARSSQEAPTTLQLKASLKDKIIGYACHEIVSDDTCEPKKHKSLLNLLIVDQSFDHWQEILTHLKHAPETCIQVPGCFITKSQVANNIDPIEVNGDTIGYWPLSEFKKRANQIK